MKFELNRVNAGRVEQNIAPPMMMAVTLPVTFEGMDIGVGIYVAVSPSATRLHGSSKSMFHKRLQEVVKQLRLGERSVA